MVVEIAIIIIFNDTRNGDRSPRHDDEEDKGCDNGFVDGGKEGEIRKVSTLLYIDLSLTCARRIQPRTLRATRRHILQSQEDPHIEQL